MNHRFYIYVFIYQVSTCIHCLELLQEPALAPCGHTACRKCFQEKYLENEDPDQDKAGEESNADRGQCGECHQTFEMELCVVNTLLAQLVGKIVYTKQVGIFIHYMLLPNSISLFVNRC